MENIWLRKMTKVLGGAKRGSRRGPLTDPPARGGNGGDHRSLCGIAGAADAPHHREEERLRERWDAALRGGKVLVSIPSTPP